MKNYITIRDALIESVHIAMEGTSIIEAVRLAFKVRRHVNQWLAIHLN